MMAVFAVFVGFSVRHPGRRDRRLAHRGRRRVRAGRHGGRLPMGLPDRDDRRGRSAAAARRILWLEFFLRRHGRADGRRHARACCARRARPAHVVRPIPLDGVPRVPLARDRRMAGAARASSPPAPCSSAPGLAGDARALSQVLSRRRGSARSAMGSSPHGGRLTGCGSSSWPVLVGFGRDRDRHVAGPRARARGPGFYLASALGDPLRDFFTRYRGSAVLILALICTYRLSDFVLNIMNPFYHRSRVHAHRSRRGAEDLRRRGVGAGVFAGGFAVARLGLMRAL